MMYLNVRVCVNELIDPGLPGLFFPSIYSVIVWFGFFV